MESNGFLLLVLIIVAIVFWILFLSPQAQEKKAERMRLEAEERERKLKLETDLREKREAEKQQIKKKRDDYIKNIRKNKPDFILQARIDFERAYKASGGRTSFFGQEKSPLACFGYVVGKTKGRKPIERQQIIEYTLCAEIPDFFPKSYSLEWGTPLSITRFNKIHSHITSMADLRSSRRNFEVAVSDWRNDASWIQRNLAEKVGQ